ncbi:hypothetical protein D3C80_1841330 [compost metagenome]
MNPLGPRQLADRQRGGRNRPGPIGPGLSIELFHKTSRIGSGLGVVPKFRIAKRNAGCIKHDEAVPLPTHGQRGDPRDVGV